MQQYNKSYSLHTIHLLISSLMFFLFSDNTRLWCNNITDLIASMRNASFSLQFLNRNNTMCIILRGGNYWFKFVDPVPFHQLEKFEQVNIAILMKTSSVLMIVMPVFNTTKKCSFLQLFSTGKQLIH